eukprot:COSAG06_NODE_135_length_22418_cov_9.162104_17_plen_216_part_00
MRACLPAPGRHLTPSRLSFLIVLNVASCYVTHRKKMDAKKKLKKAEAEAFLDPVKAEEEKEKGNEKFKEGDFHGALKHYSDAIARDPKNHKLYSNRCAAFQKIGQMPAALEDCEKCIALDPTFVKIYNRKGSIQFYLKEFHKCTETFEKVIELEPVRNRPFIRMMTVTAHRCAAQHSTVQRSTARLVVLCGGRFYAHGIHAVCSSVIRAGVPRRR